MLATDSAEMSLEAHGKHGELKFKYGPTPGYRGHRPGESAKICKLCGTVQVRKITRYGPVLLRDCMQVTRGFPHFSDSKVWWNLPFRRWTGPPDPPTNIGWYVIVVKATCQHCVDAGKESGEHVEKIYRRQYGPLPLWLDERESARNERLKSDAFRIKPFSEIPKEYLDPAFKPV